MGKETIIFRQSREKVDKEKYSKDDRKNSSRGRVEKIATKKNISKKDSDRIRKVKEFRKKTEYNDRK
jgi:hypothetical protein